MSDFNENKKDENQEYEDICFMCHRPESKAGKMFHLPGNVTVCDECMHKTMDAMSHMDMSSMMSNPDMLNSLNLSLIHI